MILSSKDWFRFQSVLCTRTIQHRSWIKSRVFHTFYVGLPDRRNTCASPRCFISLRPAFDIAPIDGFLSAEYTLINTINNAAFNPKPLLETQPRCPTGNCTWPPFTSLGFCFKCQNVSQLVRDSSTYVDRFEYIKSSTVRIPAESARPRRNYTWSYTWRTYNYKFPELNGQILHTTPVGSLQHSLSTTFETSEGRNPAFFVIQLGWDGFTAFNFTDGASIPTVSLLLLIRTSTQQSHPGGVLAADLCALSFCAQKRKVSMVLNQLSSVILETVHGTKNVQSKPVQDGYATEDDLEAGLSFTGADFNMSFSELGFGKDPSLWLINLEDLIKAFEGNLSGTPGSSAVPKATSNFIGAFNASSNISMTMNNIATAMTNYFRDSSNITVTGQVGQTESYVHVNWLWIILPAFLVLAGTIFLLLAMFESKRSGACVWKTSELALLFHGLETSHPELNAPHRSSEMEDMASKINVKMAITSDGRRILRQEKSSIMVTWFEMLGRDAWPVRPISASPWFFLLFFNFHFLISFPHLVWSTEKLRDYEITIYSFGYLSLVMKFRPRKPLRFDRPLKIPISLIYVSHSRFLTVATEK